MGWGDCKKYSNVCACGTKYNDGSKDQGKKACCGVGCPTHRDLVELADADSTLVAECAGRTKDSCGKPCVWCTSSQPVSEECYDASDAKELPKEIFSCDFGEDSMDPLSWQCQGPFGCVVKHEKPDMKSTFPTKKACEKTCKHEADVLV